MASQPACWLRSPVLLRLRLLLFVYILGGPIGDGLGDAARGAPYVDFLVPGILMMTVAAGSSTTAINVWTDMTGGIIDRFWTMAVTRGAVLTGHVGGSVLRTLVTTTVVTGVALLVGFRPEASVVDWLAVVGIVAAFSFAGAGVPAGDAAAAAVVDAAVVPLLEVPTGILADRWSRRGVMILASIAGLLHLVIGALSHNVTTYIVASLLLGAFIAFQSGTVDALVYDVVVEVTWFMPAALAFGLVTRAHGVYTGGWLVAGLTALAALLVVHVGVRSRSAPAVVAVAVAAA